MTHVRPQSRQLRRDQGQVKVLLSQSDLKGGTLCSKQRLLKKGHGSESTRGCSRSLSWSQWSLLCLWYVVRGSVPGIQQTPRSACLEMALPLHGERRVESIMKERVLSTQLVRKICEQVMNWLINLFCKILTDVMFSKCLLLLLIFYYPAPPGKKKTGCSYTPHFASGDFFRTILK